MNSSGRSPGSSAARSAGDAPHAGRVEGAQLLLPDDDLEREGQEIQQAGQLARHRGHVPGWLIEVQTRSDREAGEYLDIPVDEQVEALSLLGDVARRDGEPQVHAHAVVGHVDGHATGGHLRRAVVWPTLEVVVEETPAHLQKRFDPETGLAPIDLDWDADGS